MVWRKRRGSSARMVGDEVVSVEEGVVLLLVEDDGSSTR
jgi:hypothetical protein